jgi:hypothetical protein
MRHLDACCRIRTLKLLYGFGDEDGGSRLSDRWRQCFGRAPYGLLVHAELCRFEGTHERWASAARAISALRSTGSNSSPAVCIAHDRTCSISSGSHQTPSMGMTSSFARVTLLGSSRHPHLLVLLNMAD